MELAARPNRSSRGRSPRTKSVRTGMSWPVSGPYRREGGRAVVAQHASVDGHHQPVVHAHPRHLQQHVPAEVTDLRSVSAPGDDSLEQGFCVRAGTSIVYGSSTPWSRTLRRVGGSARGGSASGEVPGERRRGRRRSEQGVHVVGEPCRGGVQVAVRAEGRDHPSGQGARRQRGVPGQVVERIVSGGEDLDPELFEQCPGPDSRESRAAGWMWS